VHTRRIATFLLGAWISCSLFMAFIAIQNLRSPGAVMSAPIEPAAKLIQSFGQDQAGLLLRHLAAEQNRHYFYLWEQAQILLGLALGGCLILATQRRIFPMVLCGVMLALVLFQHITVTPELAYRGRETDFPPGNAVFGAQARVWALHQVYVGAEAVKLVIGGVLASYLFVFRTRRRSRKEAAAVNHADHSVSAGDPGR